MSIFLQIRRREIFCTHVVRVGLHYTAVEIQRFGDFCYPDILPFKHFSYVVKRFLKLTVLIKIVQQRELYKKRMPRTFPTRE